MSKEKVLKNINHALKKNPLPNQRGEYQDIILPVEQDKIEEYKRLQSLNKAELFETQESEISQNVNLILQKEGIERILIPNSLVSLDLQVQKVPYDRPMEELKDELFNVECGILEADYGVANLGIVCVTSSKIQPRLLSLITKHCIILLKKEKILGNLSEVLHQVKQDHNEVLPSNILFIAGPSRTADIELQVVFGVHGPQKTYVVLY